jgi:hypothetical protein
VPFGFRSSCPSVPRCITNFESRALASPESVAKSRCCMANPCSAVARRNTLSTAIHRNRSQTRRRLGTVALVWHWWRQVPDGLLFPRRILTCPRSQMICPAGSRLEPAMSSRAVAGAKELFASICDISNFPTAGTSICRPMLRIAGARRGGGARGGGQSENNFACRNRPRRPSVELTAPGGVPPSPQPLTHPARDPGPFWRRGLPLWNFVENLPRELRRSLASACMCALPMRRWCRRRVGGPLPSGRNPARFFAG